MKTLKKIYDKMSLGLIVTIIVLLIGVMLIIAEEWWTLTVGTMMVYLAVVSLDGLETLLEENN